MNNDIIINKEGDGDVYDLLRESSDDSSIDIIQTPVKQKKKFVAPKKVKQDIVVDRSEYKRDNDKREKPFSDSMFEVFTNPDKTRAESEDEDENEGTFPGNQHDNDNNTDIPDQCENNNSFCEEDEIPSQGFQTVEDEKQDLLYKFYRLQSKGVPSSRKFNIHSDVKEMRNEYDRIKRDMEVNSSLRFSRRMLMACITGIEFLNKRYDPFDVLLEGWSESVIENVSDYDNVFERLHDKYSSKIAMAPEIELLLSLTGSAFMFHLTNSMFSNNMPNLRDMAQQNPDIIKNMMQAMATASNPSKDNSNNDKQTSSDENNTNENHIREMKPPILDIQSLMSNTPFSAIGNSNFPQATRIHDITVQNPPMNTPPTPIRNFSPPPSIDLSDNNSEICVDDATRTISLNSESHISRGGTRRKRSKKLSMNDQNSVTI